MTEEELQQHLAELRDQLAHTPVEDVVANLAYQLFEIGALHLSLTPPQLEQARLAVDTLAAVVESVGSRLGPRGTDLSEGLAQLRMFYVQVNAAAQAGGEAQS